MSGKGKNGCGNNDNGNGGEKFNLTYRVDLSNTGGRFGFGKAEGGDVFIHGGLLGEISGWAENIGLDRTDEVWVVSEAVSNPDEDKRAETPFACFPGCRIISVTREKPASNNGVGDVVAQADPLPIEHDVEQEMARALREAGATGVATPDPSPVQPAMPDITDVEPDEVPIDRLIVPLGGGIYRIHGTLVDFVKMMAEVLGQLGNSDRDVCLMTAVTAAEIGHDLTALDEEGWNIRRLAQAKRLEEMVIFLMEVAGDGFLRLREAANQAPTVAELAIQKHPEGAARLGHFYDGLTAPESAEELEPPAQIVASQGPSFGEDRRNDDRRATGAT